MKYNLFITTFIESYNIFDVNDDNLQEFVENYNYGKESFFIHGKKYCIKNLSEIKIITSENPPVTTEKEWLDICKKRGLPNIMGDGYVLSTKILEEIGQGQDVTDDFIKGTYGYLRDE